MVSRFHFVALTALALMSACTESDTILPGEREAIRDALDADTATAAARDGSRPASLGSVSRNASWSQAPGTPSTRTDHPALNSSLTQVWSAPIGQGDKRRARITADPVAADGRVFTLDSAATVTATSSAGQTLWQVDLTPLRDRAGQASGGALALGGGRLYVTSAFGHVTALDPATGAEIWQQRLQNTGTGAPTYFDGVLYLVSGDSTAWAIEADSGRIRWQIDSVGDAKNVAGGPAPVVTSQYAVFSFGASELVGTFRQGGLRLWNTGITGQRNGITFANVSDITGDPVLVGDTLYAGNSAGSFVALEVANGQRRWTVAEGANGPAWVTQDSVYFVTDRFELVRLDAATGELIWAQALPGYVERRRPQKRRDRAFVHHGPVLAGGRLVVASNDGLIRHYAPEDGALLGTTEVRSGATAQPIVVDGTLYVVTSGGDLVAFR